MNSRIIKFSCRIVQDEGDMKLRNENNVREILTQTGNWKRFQMGWEKKLDYLNFSSIDLVYVQVLGRLGGPLR